MFVGPDIDHAITTLRRLQTVMDNRYRYLMGQQRRKIVRGDGMNAIVLAMDEIAYFSATVGDKTQRETFSALLRDIVARGRAVAVIVVGATQRPTADIIPTSLRDIFSWRMAGRCTTDVSSDVILGYGWAARGYSAATIHPHDQGVVWLVAEDGHPRRIKVAYLDDDDIIRLAAYARDIRRPGPITADTDTAPPHPPPRTRRPNHPHTQHGCGPDPSPGKRTGRAAATTNLERTWRHARYPTHPPTVVDTDPGRHAAHAQPTTWNRHGWIQGTYYDATGHAQPAGLRHRRLAIAAYGYPTPGAVHATSSPTTTAQAGCWLDFVNAEFTLAALHRPTPRRPGRHPRRVHDWNDSEGPHRSRGHRHAPRAPPTTTSRRRCRMSAATLTRQGRDVTRTCQDDDRSPPPPWSARSNPPGPPSAPGTRRSRPRSSSSAPAPARTRAPTSSTATTPPCAGSTATPNSPKSSSPAKACAAPRPKCSPPCCTRPPTPWPTGAASKTPPGKAAGTTDTSPTSPPNSA